MAKKVSGQIVSWWPEALAALGKYPFFAQVIETSRGTGLMASDDLMRTFVRAVCGQQISSKAAEKLAANVFALAQNAKLPLDSAVLHAGEEGLRAAGLSPTKTAALMNLARAHAEGRTTRERLEGMSDGEIRALLTQFKGIGKWTADMILIFGLNRPDVWADSDYGLRKAWEASALTLDPGTLSPWRTAAVWLLWRSRSPAPVQY